METRIRKMRMSDVPTITKYDLVMLGETLGEEAIRQHLSDNVLMRYLVMENQEASEIIGQMSLWIDEDKSQIHNFYIIKKYQRQNLGKRFLEYVLDYLKSKGINEITLEVRASNSVAVRLYEQYNFKVVSVRKHYYADGEDAYLMYLRIGSD